MNLKNLTFRVTARVAVLALVSGCNGGGGASDAISGPVVSPNAAPSGRGFPAAAPWVSFYGTAAAMGDLNRAAGTFRVLNIDADPGVANFGAAQIAQLKAGGQNRVISYLNVGAMEHFRSYWTSAPGFVSGRDNAAAQLGPYAGYPDETWMDVSNADYQRLLLDYVAPRLVALGIDGFFLDNFELIEHGPRDANGPCSATCRQGGLDLVYNLRARYPNLLIVMQNATSDVTRLGVTHAVAFPSLLDGISHEEAYAPTPSLTFQQELRNWRGMNLNPGGRPFWIATEDYVGSCANTTGAKAVYDASRAEQFSPYASDASSGQLTVCYWPF